jgi:hypothetical protein
MLVVMTVAAVVVGLATTTMHLLMRAEHEATKESRFSASVTRLARAFREDLHAARKVELPDPEPGKPPALVVALDAGRHVRYELDAHRAMRVETDGAVTVRHEDYHFPTHSQLRLEQGDRGLVRFLIEMPAPGLRSGPPSGGPAAGPVTRLAIEAAPARARSSTATAQNDGDRNDDDANGEATDNRETNPAGRT